MNLMIIGFLSDGCAACEMTFLMAPLQLNIILFIFVITLHRPPTSSIPLLDESAKMYVDKLSRDVFRAYFFTSNVKANLQVRPMSTHPSSILPNN